MGRESTEVDRFQCFATEALEPAGEVADTHSKEDLGVQTAAAGHEPSHEPPVFGSAPRGVSRAEREVDVIGRLDQSGHVSRGV